MPFSPPVVFGAFKAHLKKFPASSEPASATPADHCPTRPTGGKTGHAEAVEVNYDPQIITYGQLLDIFFKIHNPTTKDRQGPDIGHQYRSAVFYANDMQKDAAVKKVLELNRSGRFQTPVVTEIVPLKTFYPAEEYHQHYHLKHGQTSCCLTPEC